MRDLGGLFATEPRAKAPSSVSPDGSPAPSAMHDPPVGSQDAGGDAPDRLDSLDSPVWMRAALEGVDPHVLTRRTPTGDERRPSAPSFVDRGTP